MGLAQDVGDKDNYDALLHSDTRCACLRVLAWPLYMYAHTRSLYSTRPHPPTHT